MFLEYAQQRSELAAELQHEVSKLGGVPEKSGSVGGSLHRGWMNLKAAITGKDEGAIVAEKPESYEGPASRNVRRSPATFSGRRVYNEAAIDNAQMAGARERPGLNSAPVAPQIHVQAGTEAKAFLFTDFGNPDAALAQRAGVNAFRHQNHFSRIRP